jgi:hypothetical protein
MRTFFGFEKLRADSVIRFSITLLVAVASTTTAQRGLAQTAQLSDTLFVSANLTATPNNPNPQTLFPIGEGANNKETFVTVPLKDLLLKPGYVEFFEADGRTPSDFLVSVTGASLQFYSDGAVDASGLPVFPPNVNGLPDLGAAAGIKFVEDAAKGLTANVGNLFAIPGGFPVAAGDIVMTSDGNVPEPTTLSLTMLGLIGLLSYAQRSSRSNA